MCLAQRALAVNLPNIPDSLEAVLVEEVAVLVQRLSDIADDRDLRLASNRINPDPTVVNVEHWSAAKVGLDVRGSGMVVDGSVGRVPIPSLNDYRKIMRRTSPRNPALCMLGFISTGIEPCD